MSDPNVFNPEVGLLKKGWITSYDSLTGELFVKLNNGPLSSNNPPVPVKGGPHVLFQNNGLYIGTLPEVNTPIIVADGNSGEYHFVSFYAENPDIIPELTDGQLLIRSNDFTRITLDLNNNINIGSERNNIHIETSNNIISTNFDNQFNFSHAGRKINGVIKRDLKGNNAFDPNSKLENVSYDTEMYVISLDPTASPYPVVSGSRKNPPFVENREMIYEFQYSAEISDDLTESTAYSNTGTKNKTYSRPNRRKSRADTLSLSLVAPNFLIESVSGTVVDIFGNILDLNRFPLPVGKDGHTLQPDTSSDKVTTFLHIKELQRKSLAFHWELNARKDLTGSDGRLALPNIKENKDYARDRSRFFIDIDKEGQFKINIPASSEKGNIPLLTRYENYSTFGDEDDGNPNKLIQPENKQDIFHDSFASPKLTLVTSGAGFLQSPDRGSVSIQGEKNVEAAPKDRITGSHIKHGTAYHDILQTCFLHQDNSYMRYQAGEVDPLTVDTDSIPALKDIVSTTIITSGNKANAGGRSGSINLDGFIELNVGANTVDRQSMWVDTAGGIVANIGRDIRGRSVMASTGGDFYLQVGGFGIIGDSRFEKGGINPADNGIKGGVLDLRILTDGGYCHMIRCDNNGITILTAGNMAVHAKGDLTLTSDRNIRIECANLIMQERAHIKLFGGSS